MAKPSSTSFPNRPTAGSASIQTGMVRFVGLDVGCEVGVVVRFVVGWLVDGAACVGG